MSVSVNQSVSVTFQPDEFLHSIIDMRLLTDKYGSIAALVAAHGAELLYSGFGQEVYKLTNPDSDARGMIVDWDSETIRFKA